MTLHSRSDSLSNCIAVVMRASSFEVASAAKRAGRSQMRRTSVLAFSTVLTQSSGSCEASFKFE